jgi:hypothetical protein
VTRDVVSRLLLAASALVMAGAATIHALAFPGAAPVIDSSSMPAFFSGAFKALWLTNSTHLVGLALAFLLGALAPQVISRPLISALALAPLAAGGLIYLFIGGFFAGHLMVGAGALALMGALLRQPSTLPARIEEMSH